MLSLSTDLVVSGDGAPSPNGGYNEDGIYNGHMSYKSLDGLWYIWFASGPDSYAISDLKGSTETSWINNLSVPAGAYAPYNDTTGNPVVV
jgi:hypothetical protein